MNNKLTRWLAVGLGLIAFVMTIVAVVLLLPNHGYPNVTDLSGLVNDATSLFLATVIVWLGAFLVTQRPKHRIGWVLLFIGFFDVLSIASTQYSIYAMVTKAGAVPGGIWVTWVSQWAWTVIYASLTLLLLLFPTGHLPSPRWRWVAYVSLAIFAGLFCLGAFTTPLFVNETTVTLPNPLGFFYFYPEGIFFSALAMVVLLPLIGGVIALVLRFYRAQGDERAQLKWFTYAAVLSISMFALSNLPLFGEWAGVISTLVFVTLPVAIVISILEYRLYEIDILINRTLVYVPLTAILAGLFAATITLSQKLFVGLTGQQSDAATVLTTLVVVAAFEPLKSALQHVVDRRFKEVADPGKELQAFGDQVRSVVQVLRVEQLTQRLGETATRAFNAQGGAVFLGNGANPKMLYASKEWNGDTELSVPLEVDGKLVGQLKLSGRRNGAEYTLQDRELLQQIAEVTAHAIALDERVDGLRQ